MATGSAEYHEPLDRLSEATQDMHRALVSLQEELEAVDWYQQRIDATSDEALKRILAHNRDEEKEHALMVLEWIRRKDPLFDRLMRTYLFSSGEITEIEEAMPEPDALRSDAEAGQAAPPAPPQPTLTVGSLIE